MRLITLLLLRGGELSGTFKENAWEWVNVGLASGYKFGKLELVKICINIKYVHSEKKK